MKKSQFITIFIMLVAASVLIFFGCFLDAPKSESEPGNTADPVEILPTMPWETGEIREQTPTPENTESAPTATPEPTVAETESPTESEWPAIPFPEIKNVDFVQYGTKFDHFSTRWVTGSDNQNKAEIFSSVQEIIKDIDYVFYIYESDTEWNHYMTFSLHYEYGCTAKILDLLKRYDIKAVFFVTQKYIIDNPDLVRRMKEEGHVIGNRGIIGDENISKLTAETFAEGLLAVEQEYQKLFGATERMYFFRTDYFNERLLKVAEAMGYTVVFRTYTYYMDYKDATVASLLDRFNARAAYNGSVPEYTGEKLCYETLEQFIPNMIDQNVHFKLIERRH